MSVNAEVNMAVKNQWNGMVDWNTGMNNLMLKILLSCYCTTVHECYTLTLAVM